MIMICGPIMKQAPSVRMAVSNTATILLIMALRLIVLLSFFDPWCVLPMTFKYGEKPNSLKSIILAETSNRSMLELTFNNAR